MGIFVLQRMFNFQSRFLGTLVARFEARRFVKDVKNMVNEYKKMEVVVSTHKLNDIKDMEEHMIKYGRDAVIEAYALFTHDMLALDDILRSLPKVEMYKKYLEKVKEGYPEKSKEYRTLTRMQNGLVDGKAKLYSFIEPQLRNLYKKLLNMMEATEKQDRETFMQSMIEIWKTEGTSYWNYFRIRREARAEMKERDQVRKFRNNIAKELKRLLKAKQKGKLDGKVLADITTKINKATEGLIQHTKEAFKDGYNVAMRSTLALFTLIGYLNRLYKENEKLAEQHQIPQKMAETIENEIRQIFTLEHDNAAEEIKEVHAVQSRAKIKLRDTA